MPTPEEEMAAAQKEEAKHALESARSEKASAQHERESAQAQKGGARVAQPDDFSML